MLDSASTIERPALKNQSENENCQTIKTRFGDFGIDNEKIITFAKGLYGFEQHRHFILTQVPNWPNAFKLLQSTDDSSLSLIALPLKEAGEAIDREDFSEACGSIGFDEEKTAVLGLVTMRSHSQDQAFTVNLKAPLLIETEARQGCQYVFASDKYLLRHPLPVDEG